MFSFFFFHLTASTLIYTLSLHDALPILSSAHRRMKAWRKVEHSLRECGFRPRAREFSAWRPAPHSRDRKSTRLNSSHTVISYAVFCLKKKKQREITMKDVYSCGDADTQI